MKIRGEGAELFQTQRHLTKLTVALSGFDNAPKNYIVRGHFQNQPPIGW
jgi:hypothetical protein